MKGQASAHDGDTECQDVKGNRGQDHEDEDHPKKTDQLGSGSVRDSWIVLTIGSVCHCRLQFDNLRHWWG